MKTFLSTCVAFCISVIAILSVKWSAPADISTNDIDTSVFIESADAYLPDFRIYACDLSESKQIFLQSLCNEYDISFEMMLGVMHAHSQYGDQIRQPAVFYQVEKCTEVCSFYSLSEAYCKVLQAMPGDDIETKLANYADMYVTDSEGYKSFICDYCDSLQLIK